MFKWGMLLVLGAIFVSFVNKAGEAITSLVVQVGICGEFNYTCHWMVNVVVVVLFLSSLYLYDMVTDEKFIENRKIRDERRISISLVKDKPSYLDLRIQNKIPKSDEIIIEEVEAAGLEDGYSSLMSYGETITLLRNKKSATRFIVGNNDDTFSVIDKSNTNPDGILPKYGVGRHGFYIEIKYRILVYEPAVISPPIKIRYQVVIDYKEGNKYKVYILQDHRYKWVRASLKGV